MTLAKREDAEDAIAELQNASLLGRSVKISQATSDRDSGSKHSSVDVHGPPPPAPADAFRIDSWPPPPPPKDAKDSRKRGPTQLDLDDEEDSRSDRSSRRRKRGAPVGMNIVSDWRAVSGLTIRASWSL